jgi:hypothetical protein
MSTSSWYAHYHRAMKVPNAMFLFPFPENFDKKDRCWSCVLYRWIENQTFLFHCSSDTQNWNKYSVEVVRKIPDNILSLFRKCPVWSLNEDAKWIKVPFVKFNDTTAKSFILFSMYILIMSKSLHTTLLLMQHLPDYHKSKMKFISRGWISFMLHFKCCFVPTWLKRLMKKDSAHLCTISWCKKKVKEYP